MRLALYCILSPTFGLVLLTHGSYTKTIGSQTIYNEDKEAIYNVFMGIYRKYNDEKLEEIDDSSTLQWLE